MIISDRDAIDTYRSYLEHGTYRDTADKTGLSLGAVQRRVEAYRERKLGTPTKRHAAPANTGVHGLTPTLIVADEINPEFNLAVANKLATIISPMDARLIALKDENSALKHELKQAVRDNLTTEKVRSEIIGVTAIPANPPNWLVDLKNRDHSGPGIPMTIWSDWHWGEVVKRNEVGGVNEFNLAVAKRRARRLLDTTIKLAFNHQVQQGYPGIVVFLGGDMIGGEIHSELADTNEMKTIPAVVDLFGVLIAMLQELSGHFPEVFVAGVVGNHGRNTLKPRAKGRVHTSYEWLLYVMLENYFKDRNKKIRFFIPTDIDALIRVNSTRYLLTHGDALGVKGGDGIIGSIGPIMRGRIKVGDSYSHIGRDFDILVQGHWHQYLPMPSIITNGSLKGYCDYARTMLRAPFQRPIQAMWYDHHKVGITKHEPLYLEDQLDGVGGKIVSGGWVSHYEGAR